MLEIKTAKALKDYIVNGYPENFVMLFMVAAVAYHQIPIYAIAFILLSWLVCKNYTWLFENIWKTGVFAVVITAAITITLPFSLSNSQTALFHYASTVMVSLGAFAMTKTEAKYYLASGFTLYCYLIILATSIVIRGSEQFPLDNLIPDKSQNGLTSYLIVIQANYCVISYLYKKKIPLVTLVVTFWVCIVGYGRGSIVASVMLLGFSIAFVLVTRGLTKLLVSILFVYIMVSLIDVTKIDHLFEFIENQTKIGAGLRDDHRDIMNDEYLALLNQNPASIIFGADYYGSSIESIYGGNPHNSFIRAHHIFGIPYLMSVLLVFLVVCWKGFNKKVFYPLLMIAVMISRAYTETMLFPTFLDLFFFGACSITNTGLGKSGSSSFPPESGGAWRL